MKKNVIHYFTFCLVSLLVVFILSVVPKPAVAAQKVISLESVVTGKTGNVFLKSKKEAVYTVSQPIKNVKVNLIGHSSGSTIKANYNGTGKNNTPYLVSYAPGVKNITIRNITFDLAKKGRGSLYFSKVQNLKLYNNTFTGYSKKYGYYKTDSSVLLENSKNITIEKNSFLNNGFEYSNRDGDLNRSITIQGNASNQVKLLNNRFYKVNQAVVAMSTGMNSFQIKGNRFEQVVDNALYLLKIGRADITNNTFLNSADEGIVISGGTFNIYSNRATNIRNKFLAIDGTAKSVDFAYNNVVTNLASKQSRPSAITWRPGREKSLVTKMTIRNNTFNLDTAPSNYDVFPLGNVKTFTFTNNKVILQKLATYQKLFAFKGRATIQSANFTKNTITSRQKNGISTKSIFIREDAANFTPIKKLTIKSTPFRGQLPKKYKYTK
ncbi:right-handed parallel beta-helix repeat-containing protein [Listeria fleischmannii]|uniref:Right-handed parallel beta-helix repeat-containing protein n=1 Tax=Listeria fleischmannii TaxID=1069827 RepID=A0A841YF59_9LIST|nr:right-handed parallel beta-helix repeat-containing protein [Listeria fleischmannii]EIA19615.1 hypothetical protein KKC_11481 [Listeria fleischmannii subsp. coloradonensis]MBC1399015.1 right-handed parallel beta-helix repeat-containing protein [Listeria fleischmannii]MBC1427268.1 right-handed parallel beta-helix repeat-containing protein [Listeria fleischmannii]STY34648.1 Uncharacterised protein [Listeria fleischmannii subsp. coloradonensis]